tara:strand:+ start:516 stop:698 length:183 start_codon:yes stop_codon:yes gene_type:complete
MVQQLRESLLVHFSALQDKSLHRTISLEYAYYRTKMNGDEKRDHSEEWKMVEAAGVEPAS